MTNITKDDGKRVLPFDGERLLNFVESKLYCSEGGYFDKVVRTINQYDEYKAEQITELLIQTALELIDEADPGWTYVAAKAYLERLYKQAARNRSYSAEDKYGDFYGLIKTMASKGIYSGTLLEKYSRDELREIGELINPEKDKLFDYPGLQLLSSRYLAKDHAGNTYELPQERWLIIAATNMQNESKDKRLDLIKESYWALSNLYMTVATPTLANSGLTHGQLSSCFIDTVEDSLIGIYNSNTDIARLSKDGGGIGVYMGKVRSRGSSIKGYKGASSGVIPWIRQLNNTAVSVDQLG